MQEFGLSGRGSYSTVTDEELDNIILGIKIGDPPIFQETKIVDII